MKNKANEDEVFFVELHCLQIHSAKSLKSAKMKFFNH